MRRCLGITILCLALLPSEVHAAKPAIVGRWHLNFDLVYCTFDDCDYKTTDRTWIIRRFMRGGHYQYRLLFELTNGGFERFKIRPKGKSWVGERRGSGPWCERSGVYVGSGVENVSIRVAGDYLEAFYTAMLSGKCPSGSYTVNRERRHFAGNRVQNP